MQDFRRADARFAATIGHRSDIAAATHNFYTTHTATLACVEASLRANLLGIQSMLETLSAHFQRSRQAGERVTLRLAEPLPEITFGPTFVRAAEVEDDSSDDDLDSVD